ncbi:hypothetical protein T440DRAFT_463147 [Plenodomus tracheiphilus IPT5]|uniref:Uncharacterized protein n=1 Tax=Plenodomus tracheiphilus IPT5 TaxID=1408161 RepID=A0A6A7BNK5_9PLEO|nr:hypothetical protein T440DRAFT_463147 [Plenodomus tracheiphilus IPT5]
MSGAGENRWRRQGQANRQNQDRSSGTSTPTKDGPRPQATTAPSGSAWGAKGKPSGPAPVASAPAQAAEQHVPVRDFNATEVKDFLRKKYLESTAGQTSVYHKVEGDSVPKRSSGAWGAKSKNMAHLMPSGQSFFTHLRKQLANIEATKPAQ